LSLLINPEHRGHKNRAKRDALQGSHLGVMPLYNMNNKQPKDKENSKAGYSYGREQ